MRPPKFSNRDRLELLDRESARPYQLFKSSDRHLIQTSGAFAIPRGPIAADMRSPFHEGGLGEHHVRPGKHAYQVAAERVIPCWAEADQYQPSGNQEFAHRPENGSGIVKMLKRVERHYDVSFYFRAGGK